MAWPTSAPSGWWGSSTPGRAKEGYEGESNDLRVGGGGGIFLRILRSTQLGLNFAGGPDGFLFSMGTGWSF